MCEKCGNNGTWIYEKIRKIGWIKTSKELGYSDNALRAVLKTYANKNNINFKEISAFKKHYSPNTNKMVAKAGIEPARCLWQF